MAASFREVWSNCGVDQDTKPVPGMIVPVGGSNMVCLVDGQNLHVKADAKLQIEEVPNVILAGPQLVLAGLTMNYPAMFRAAFALTGSQRFFKISAKHVTGYSGAQVQAVDGNSKVVAALRVVALKKKTVKLSIRPVQVRDANGKLIFHTKLSFDAKKLCSEMNLLWTPQANVVFELVSSTPALIDDQVQIAKILGLANQRAPLPRQVDIIKFAPLFVKLKDPKAAYTIFLVERVAGGDLGATISEQAFGLVGDDRTERTMAHEAGHWLGSFSGPTGWVRYGHQSDRGSALLLMRAGGAGWKIPFDQTLSHFNSNY